MGFMETLCCVSLSVTQSEPNCRIQGHGPPWAHPHLRPICRWGSPSIALEIYRSLRELTLSVLISVMIYDRKQTQIKIHQRERHEGSQRASHETSPEPPGESACATILAPMRHRLHWSSQARKLVWAGVQGPFWGFISWAWLIDALFKWQLSLWAYWSHATQSPHHKSQCSSFCRLSGVAVTLENRILPSALKKVTSQKLRENARRFFGQDQIFLKQYT